MAGIFLGVVLLWGACLSLAFVSFDTWAERGQFGDLFGAVNALFSGLAFAAFLYALHLQRQELGLQRTELRMQREEMTKSREELSKQVKTQQAQLRTAIAQLKVAAQEAEVEALKMEAEMHPAYLRNDQVAQIRSVATTIESIAAELESSSG